MLFRRNSLPERLVKFFQDNPDEELTFAAAQIKFDVTAVALQTALQRLREVEVLESVRVIRLPAKGRA